MECRRLERAAVYFVEMGRISSFLWENPFRHFALVVFLLC